MGRKLETKKKRRKGQGKGSAFERTICKQLSLWWTDGERDDVFWRTSQSGGRATSRSKTGKRTRNQYGDVQATDPIGQPLIDLCTIEIKRGYGNSTYFDLIDQLEKETKQPYLKFIKQAIEEHIEARSYSWMLITKRDRKNTLIAMPVRLKRLLIKAGGKLDDCYPQITLRFLTSGDFYEYKIFITTFDIFMFSTGCKCFQKALKIFNI